MPSFTEFTRGTIVTATFLNQIEKGLYWLQLDVLRSTMESALQGLVASHISMFYDLFSDTSEFDSGAVTPDMEIDTADGVITLPSGFSTDTDYYYQSILHTMPATVTKANMLLLREDIANTTVYPSLSCVGSGAGASFTEKTTPVATRNVTSTLDQWTEDFATTGNSGAYTVNFDTAAGNIKLTGAAAGNFNTPAAVTSNAVADAIEGDAASTLTAAKGNVSAYTAAGELVIVYASKEYHATTRNLRLRVVKTDGTLKYFGANQYLDITTSTAGTGAVSGVDMVVSLDGTYAGIVTFLYGTNANVFISVNLTAGTVAAPVTFGIGGGVLGKNAIAREQSTDFVYLANHGNTSFYLYRCLITATSVGSPLVNGAALAASSQGLSISTDQEEDCHMVLRNGTTIRYNYWDKSAGAWAYTFDSGDKTITVAHADARKHDQHMVADPTQSGSNKKVWVIYATDNGSAKSSIEMRSITNGVVASAVVFKTSASLSYRQPIIMRDEDHDLVRFTYWEAAAGLLTNTYTDAAVLGTEQVVDAAGTAADGFLTKGTEKCAVTYRVGANDDAASDLWYSDKNLGYTFSAQTWQSVLYTLGTTATKYFVSVAETLPALTTAVWEITADNGAAWDTVTLGSTSTFSTPGSQIIIKATLQTTDATVAPSVDSVDWKALLPLVEEEFEWLGLSGVDVKVKLRGRSSNASFNPQVHSHGVVVS